MNNSMMQKTSKMGSPQELTLEECREVSGGGGAIFFALLGVASAVEKIVDIAKKGPRSDRRRARRARRRG